MPAGMDLDLTPEQELIRDTVRTFARERVAPVAEKLDRESRFPVELVREMADLGLMGIPLPEEHGGAGGDTVGYAVAIEELTRVDSSVAITVAAHTSLGTMPIYLFGTDEQKARWLPDLASGRRLAAFGLTEPDAGSDAGAARTTAELRDDAWVVNGSKMFITNGVRADFIVTAVKTTEEGGHHGISFLIVDRGEGVSASPIEKMGWHASDTALIAFDDVFVPEENLLGTEHEGFKLIMANFQWERVMMALGAVGAMEALFERTLAFAKQRVQFGRPIGKNQAIRHKLAEVAVALETGRAITYNALRLHLAGANAVQEVTMAKLATQRAAFDAADACLQIHGGAGYLEETGIARAARDARLGPIGGGTDEIMREILGKTLGL
jgi:acyl-CoA dehydrogenase